MACTAWEKKKGLEAFGRGKVTCINEIRLKGKLLPDVRDTDVEMADFSTGPQQSDHSKQA